MIAATLLLFPTLCLGQEPASQEGSFADLLHRGFALHQSAEYAQALPLLQRAWKLEPHDYFVNLLLGIDLLRTGEPEKAVGFLSAASRARPKEDFPYEYLGEAQGLLGHYAEAATALMQAVAVTHGEPDATESWAGFTLERFRQLAGQLRSSQKGLAAEYRLQARSYPAGDSRRLELLQQSASLDPEAPGIASELACAGGNAAQCGAHLAGSQALPPLARKDADAWFTRGVALAEKEQCEAAIPALERGLASPKQPVYARFLLSWCYSQAAGKVDAQIRASGGNLAVAHLIRGDVLFRMQGDTAGAIAEYQAALNTQKDDPKLLERLAEAQVAQGDLAGAAGNAEAALQLDPHRYSARQTLARIAMEQGRYADALPQLTALAEQDPHDPGTQISLATTLSQLDKPDEALQHLQPVIDSGYPDQKGNLHSLLGALLRKTGHPEEAVKAFATARALSTAYQQSSHRDQEDGH
jgi:tetratricopeptide (TPR) repeat protein